MIEFLNPIEHSEVIIPMYGIIHLIAFAFMILLVALMIVIKKHIVKICANKKILKRIIAVYVVIDIFYWIVVWTYHYEPFYERFPLHLCASLSILMPLLILFERYRIFHFFAYWSICAGFISLVNPSFVHDKPLSFAFIQYLIRHYFLFLFPIFIIIGKGIIPNYKIFYKSMAGLILYAFFIFILDWITGANYMHLGKYNQLEIPFLPEKFTKWPWTYPSYVFVGIVLFHILYLFLSLKRNRKL